MRTIKEVDYNTKQELIKAYEESKRIVSEKRAKKAEKKLIRNYNECKKVIYS